MYFILLVVLFFSKRVIPFENNETQHKCLSKSVLNRYQLNPEIYHSCESMEASRTHLSRVQRRIEPIFKGKPKPRSETLGAKFNLNSNNEQDHSLVMLIFKIAKEYLFKCPPIIYYDKHFDRSENLILEMLFKVLPVSYSQGEINVRYQAKNANLKYGVDINCKSYILFLLDPLMTRQIVGPQLDSRVVVVSRSTQWKLKDFLASDLSSNIVNLLVIGSSITSHSNKERAYVLYTHKLYADGLGSNKPVVLTSWIKGALSRPHINLFPKKNTEGFAGHRFQVMAGNQPPYVFRIASLDMGGGAQLAWEGIEYRLLNMIAVKLNFSIDIVDIPNELNSKSSAENLDYSIIKHSADLGMLGTYITSERLKNADMSVGHSKDCAAFITLASKALPKYRAIMGPFQWPVWVALICIYLGAIFPIVFTDRLTLSHLIGNWSEIENMFWYVFGMFTNSLTFSGRYSWSNTQKVSTRLLIGSYWIFTIIITACYTGSIIAFVTLPAFPDTIDSVVDLLGLFFRVGTLDSGGWEYWFRNSSHEPTVRLFNKMEYVSTLEEGIGNVTQSFFWNYAFLGSRSQLEYMIQANFSNENIARRSALHLSEECFASFQIAFTFPKNSVYKTQINSFILLAQQAGLINKIENEVKWSMQRSTSGKLLQASSSSPLKEVIQEERQLTTADTEGMFLLMGIGYVIGAIALVSEIVGGITNKCRQIIKRSRRSFSTTSADLMQRTPSQAHDKWIASAKEIAHRAAQEEHQSTSSSFMGFSKRQFNLTRTTFQELYSDNYNTPQDYRPKGSNINMENSFESGTSPDAAAAEPTSERKSPLNNEKFNKPAKTLAKGNIEEIVDHLLSEEIQNTVKSFDQTSIHAPEPTQDCTNIQNNVFGSFVLNQSEQLETMDNFVNDFGNQGKPNDIDEASGTQ